MLMIRVSVQLQMLGKQLA